MLTSSLQTKGVQAFLWISLTTALLWVALWNGYPTFYPDSGTYLECGFLLETPVDRPITYGLFIVATSLGGFSLWMTILAQAILLFVTTRAFVRLFQPSGWMVPVLIATITSGVSFLTSQVMSDVFTSIMILSMLLYGFSPKGRIGWLVLYTVCCAMHTSHLPVALLLYPVLLATMRLASVPTLRAAWMKTWGLLAATVVAYVALNISMVKSTEAFYAAHLAETGDLHEYLNRACPDANYDLCRIIDRIPQSADHFLWHEQGPMHWYPDRDRMKADLGSIIGDMLKDERSRRRILLSTLRSGTKQLSAFDAGEGNVPFPAGSGVHTRMERHFGRELSRFERMRQNDAIAFAKATNGLNAYYRVATIASLIVIGLCMMVMVRLREWRFVACVGFVAIAYVVNCFVNAGLVVVVVAHRFGAKLIWFAPLLAAIGVCWLVMHWKTIRWRLIGSEQPER